MPNHSDADNDNANKMQQLIGELLLPYASRVSSGKRDRVDLQPESLIASVIKDHLDQALEASDGSEHAANNLKGAIRHKFLDRLRKGGKAGPALQFSQREAGGPDPCADEAGPYTYVMESDRLRVDAQRFEQFKRIVSDNCSDDADREVMQGYLFDRKGWTEVAKQSGLGEAAARKRLSRMRAKVLSGVLQPLREQMPAELWAIAEGAMVKRQSYDVLTAALGKSAEEIERCMARIVSDYIAELYGASCIEPIALLLPKRSR